MSYTTMSTSDMLDEFDSLLARSNRALSMNYNAEVAEVIREAFKTLQGSHPDVLARISSVIESTRGDDSEIQTVEATFRDAAKALMPTDRGAAQTLFTVAETLAEISQYWGLPRDLP
jgi:predicted transcriptional regulator